MENDGDKIVTVWKFDLAGKSIKVDVLLVDDFQKPEFIARWKIDGHDVERKSSDISKLKNAVQRSLAETLKLDWKNKLHIEVNSEIDTIEKAPRSSEYSGTVKPWQAKIEVEIKALQIATDHRGEKIHRRDAADHAIPGWPNEGKRQTDSWSEKDMCSMIDDTPENRKAIIEIFSGFCRLKTALCDLLSPRKVQHTLSSLKASKLLTDGKPREER